MLSPLLTGLIVAIKAHDGGPVLYASQRVGKDGHAFLLYKFRTMIVDADKQGPGITTARDRRITKVGVWLRRFKFDELPQLWNVLKGEMSLVAEAASRGVAPSQSASWTLPPRRQGSSCSHRY